MGRHSAPDGQDADDSDEAVVTLDDEPRGRHARRAAAGAGSDAGEAGDTDGEAPAVPRGHGGTAADWRLVREHGDVRNRCVAAVLAPFVLYALLMVVLGRTGDLLTFGWTPILPAGVLLGIVLDLGHRAHPAQPPVSPDDQRTTSPAATAP